MTTTIAKLAHLQIPLEDVVKATNNFHHDNVIGRGGLGHVYKGQLQRSGELITISALRLDRKHGGGVVEFWTEVSMLSDLKHPNIVSIVGFCDEQHEKIIVTTYEAKNGSLKEHLSNPNLTWTQRLKICVGVARALSYLHYDQRRGYGVIHLNVNSSTILLDENWEPKLSGFKVSIKQSLNRMDQVVLSEPIGTIGYLDPEIEKSKGVTCKSDIYAFGVVLFEILCGRRAYIRNDANRLLAPLVMQHYENETLPDIIHPDLKNQMSGFQISVRSLRTYSETAYSCLKEERTHRPHMLSIVNELEKALEKALKFQPPPPEKCAFIYLHNEMEDKKMIIHGNIDSARFMLDENWVAKIEDFEFAVFLPPNQKDEALCERAKFKSKYYLDPEYAKTGKLKRESDVYSFGVVMLEILCGRYADDQIYLNKSEEGLVHVARANFCNGTIEDMIDPTLKEETGKMSYISNRGANKDSLQIFLEVANLCVAKTKDQRPTMTVVLSELEKAFIFQVEQVQQPNKEQVDDKLHMATHEIPVRPSFSSFLLVNCL
ncbi:putative protein kinase RLK-Pelle-CrRLK1L-1 family [Helianthus annuus]|nr:putative protein kinase RLK-Pelle-CrRLK1L-1 family [Helianthus annuus]KAJ0519567.1 putative protein kinase RLK-Pelle-CrRLK1L-1 family [Helianthus annuus]KAJ0691360.1 putative protein kinase RLK-Pelle-CrRLK1L-1 family [Helianthus annuus]